MTRATSPEDSSDSAALAAELSAAPEDEVPSVQPQTLHKYRDLLLGGPETLSERDIAKELNVPLGVVEHYWLEMGFGPVDPDEPVFTEWDVHALKYWGESLKGLGISDSTIAALTRAQSHIADRLALWELEALVEDAERRYEIDDSSARVVAIDEMRHIADALEVQMVYAWRRQMYSLIERVTKELATRDASHSKRRFPLTRALGFVDMVSYTAASSWLGGRMVDLVERFEYLCRSVVTQSGGRVVKMIGDSVFFIADDLESGLSVVTSLIETLDETPGMLPVRASMILGDVFSRSGDVFGPPVNLAARLVDVAPIGKILTDAPTAAAVASSPLRNQYRVDDAPSVQLRGFGKVRPFIVSRIAPELQHVAKKTAKES